MLSTVLFYGSKLKNTLGLATNLLQEVESGHVIDPSEVGDERVEVFEVHLNNETQNIRGQNADVQSSEHRQIEQIGVPQLFAQENGQKHEIGQDAVDADAQSHHVDHPEAHQEHWALVERIRFTGLILSCHFSGP